LAINKQFCFGLRVSARFVSHIKMLDKKPFSRLPKDVVPSNYAIRLKPDLSKLTFEGHQDILVETSTATKSVTMNCSEIEVNEVKFKADGQSFDSGIQVTYSKEDETITLAFPEDLKVGKGTLSMSFVGQLNDKMKGFYRSKYTSADGEERFAAVTQFEPTDARLAFPCWDEPAIKATFDITLVVPKDRVALSNMPVKSDVPLDSDDAWRVVTFDRSPVMSTYLLAFVVGEYDYVESTDSNGVLVRVYTPVGKKELGRFALDVAVKTLPFYKNYFDIAYPLPKMDLIAIADFAAGAMENWGLVTYRETALLIDPAQSSAASKQRVALVVGHEIAHQWFGNLVTMEWWTHLWLNEGFASWIEYLCVDHCFPEYDIWTQFATADFTRALELDALKNSHPIEVAVGHPSEIDEIFDAISYSKGASVIRMLHDFIGDKDYRKGMNQYLTQHQYKNTFTEDLWQALGDASGKPVEKIMSTWTQQMGFPVLKVNEEKKGDTRVVTVSQEKFTADGSQDESGSLWMVPVTVSTASSPDSTVHKFVLETKETTVTIDGVNSSDWLKINVGGVGSYRTLYPQGMLDALLPSIRDLSLPPRDRLGLENDLFALARAGMLSSASVLKVIEAFDKETNYTVWADLSANLNGLSIILQYTDYHDNFKSFIRTLYAPIMAALGWDAQEGEGHLTAMLRSLVIGRIGNADNKAVVAEAKSRFAAHCDGSAQLPADLRGPVYSVALKHGGVTEYESLLKLYRAADLQEEKVRILHSLGSTRDTALLQRTLDFSLSNEVRSQDTVFVIAGTTGSVEGRELAWKFVRDNWKELHERFTGGFLLARLVKSTTENFASEEKAKEIDEFFKANPAPSAERNIQQALENIRLNAEQLKRDGELVKQFLANFQ
jgi:puromycin-sensitive aminopeptidase